ncbi:MAG: class I SAM-dependent DNA methyltransferase [Prevotella sp.]
MEKKVKEIIKKYTDDELLLDKLVVTSFARCNNICVSNSFLAKYIANEDDGLERDIEAISRQCTIEDVIGIFEITISSSERVTNGAVYTPKYIRDYIVGNSFASVRKPIGECLCADIACGCGAFLYTLAEYIHTETSLPYSTICHHIYGVDISDTSISRAKILLALAALVNGETIQETDLNLYCCNSLTFDFHKMRGVHDNHGFDLVVGNPPYVRSKHIDSSIKRDMVRWSTSKIGNADLYIPFFEIGVEMLNGTGVLGYITVNSFFKSVNARALRKYIMDNRLTLRIVDFGQQLVFKKKLAYTCLAFLSKLESDNLYYAKADVNDVMDNKEISYDSIDRGLLDSHRGWNLNQTEVLQNIRRIEMTGEPLGSKYVIKNGIATLANDVFIFRPIRIDDNYYYLVRDSKEYAIEKQVCRAIIKPNILKTEEDIPEKEEKIISPYDENNNLITEDFFANNYPLAYKYLQSCREKLDARDKGEGDYGAWYAFGRTQAISDNGLKLLFPYMSDLPHFVYMPDKDMMIYCGYAIYNDSESELLFLKRILESRVFDYYMRNTSKPYSTGYYSYAKNYVKSFGIYPFSEKQKALILSMKSKNEVDEYLSNIYRLSI